MTTILLIALLMTGGGYYFFPSEARRKIASGLAQAGSGILEGVSHVADDE